MSLPDDTFQFTVAGHLVRLRCDVPTSEIRFTPSYAPFMTSSKAGAQIELEATYGELERGPSPGELCFDSGLLWKLHRTDDAFHLSLRASNIEGQLYRRARFAPDFSSGTIRTLHPAVYHRPEMRPSQLVSPLEFPLMELVMLQYLAARGELMVHGSGLSFGDRGILFCGHSGDGKSTTAKLWRQARPDVELLNDDRLVVRVEDGVAHMHGTPWHGELPECSPCGVPIVALVFLHHGEENLLRPCPGSLAAAQLIARSFVPHWDAAGMEAVVGACGALADVLPAYDFSFTPDISAVEHVSQALGLA